MLKKLKSYQKDLLKSVKTSNLLILKTIAFSNLNTVEIPENIELIEK